MTAAETPTTSSGCCAATSSGAADGERSPPTCRAPRRTGCCDRRSRKAAAAAAVPLPVLRRRGPDAARRDADGWHCGACLRTFTVHLTGTGVQRCMTDRRRRRRRPAAGRRGRRALRRRSPTRVEQAPGRCCAGPATPSATALRHLVDGRRGARPPGRRAVPGVDVVFLDTGYHFAETIGTRDAVAGDLPVTCVNVPPLRTVAEQDAEFGAAAATSATPTSAARCARCSRWRRRSAGYRAWASGVRRDEAADPGGHEASSSGTPSAAWSRSTRSPRGPRTTSTPTSPSTACWSTRCCERLRLDRLRAVHPRRSRRARTRAPAAGRASNKVECGLHVCRRSDPGRGRPARMGA